VKYLITEVDTGGGVFYNLGFSQISTVPIALYALNAKNATSISDTNKAVSTRIGFGQSTTWVCPAGVTRITVELWGAGGGAGWHYWLCNSFFGRVGGNGGMGGYNSALVNVVPGQTYNIVIGQGGGLGNRINQNCAYCTGALISIGGGVGADGENSSFNGVISAEGGKGGSSATLLSNGLNGLDGSVINYKHPILDNGSRSYMPSSYLTQLPGKNASGGNPNGNYPCYSGSGQQLDKCVGESGYCVISY
jgi:hypothetical protein